MSDKCPVCSRPLACGPDDCPSYGAGDDAAELDCFRLGVARLKEKLAASEREAKRLQDAMALCRNRENCGADILAPERLLAQAIELGSVTTRGIKLPCGSICTIDAADYDTVMTRAWRVNSCGYVARSIGRQSKKEKRAYKLVCLHTWLMQPPKGMMVDHRDGNKLNNSRSNLRLATYRQNACNRKLGRNSTSGYKGAYWNEAAGKWTSAITAGGKNANGKTKQMQLGRFDTAEEAARAYDRAALKYFGEFARLNFPEEAKALGLLDKAGG